MFPDNPQIQSQLLAPFTRLTDWLSKHARAKPGFNHSPWHCCKTIVSGQRVSLSGPVIRRQLIKYARVLNQYFSVIQLFPSLFLFVTIQTLLLPYFLSFHNNESLYCKFNNVFYSYIHIHTTLSFTHSYASLFPPKPLITYTTSTQQQA